MPWFYLHYLTDDDATAIVRYLKDLRPVHNRIPPPLHYGLIETIAAIRFIPIQNRGDGWRRIRRPDFRHYDVHEKHLGAGESISEISSGR